MNSHLGLTALIQIRGEQVYDVLHFIIAKLMEYGYEKEHVLMIGDAVGDARAAEKNGVWFYPVLVNWEEESWEDLWRLCRHRLLT